MKKLIVIGVLALLFSVPAYRASAEFVHVYVIAPGNEGGFDFILTVANLTPARQAIGLTTISISDSSRVERTLLLEGEETRFLSSRDVSCINTTCRLVLSSQSANAFDSLLAIFNVNGDTEFLHPFRFSR